ncbi:hypothetical protein C9413_09105 [Rhizobium sp. SEMIA 4085]|uniref:Uncharacterized protein n=1 Tax=Rhizobium gallicum bv. gallicum R602sp TaxID=1041138 RepID=A0A0B4XFB6_9HYPH|nr:MULTISPECIES: hypothetical protein [Rhizobium]AJD45781.1 hypothetical protein RGR602_PC01757 [Rhizobium gallicum bv. gallicum R602sp]NNH29648.1 hypothetical protein [Rhizobium sp. SEMIA 4085]
MDREGADRVALAVNAGTSDDLREDFEAAGYPLLTTEIVAPGLIKVYPHPA